MQIECFDVTKSAQAIGLLTTALKELTQGSHTHTHTLNLSTQLKISNLVSTTHKECWGELAGQRKALGSSRIARKPATLEGEG